MKTITAVELRKDMDSYLKRVSRGEKFKVSYRGKTLAVLAADEQKAEESNAQAFFDSAKKFNQSFSPEARARMSQLTDEDIKQIRDDHMKEKYGI